jgi:hypothetical protein
MRSNAPAAPALLLPSVTPFFIGTSRRGLRGTDEPRYGKITGELEAGHPVLIVYEIQREKKLRRASRFEGMERREGTVDGDEITIPETPPPAGSSPPHEFQPVTATLTTILWTEPDPARGACASSGKKMVKWPGGRSNQRAGASR